MSVPPADAASKQITDPVGFYGRSYPRASILLDGHNEIRNDRKLAPPSANAPLLDWATKANWKMGGAKGVEKDEPKVPRPAFTAIYAFLARRQLKIKTMHPFLSSADASVLAKVDAAAAWDGLSAEEQNLYMQLAEQDAIRYEREIAEFEKEHPGLLAKKRQRSSREKRSKPKKPISAFKAFLADWFGNQTSTEATAKEIRKSASAEWDGMTEEMRAPFLEIAEGDLERWEAELEDYPEYKAKIEARALERRKRQQEKSAKRGIFRAAKKQSTRPAKLAQPKKKQAVKKSRRRSVRTRQKLAQDGDHQKPTKRTRKAGADLFDEEESDTEPEDEPDFKESGSVGGDSDEEGEKEEEATSGNEETSDQDEDNSGEDEEAEQSVERQDAEKEASAEPADDNDLEISDVDEGPEPAPLSHAQAMADEAALDASDEEDEDAALRTAGTPADLLIDSSAKDGLFGWAKSALMSGIRGVWGNSQRETQDGTEQPGDQPPQDAPEDLRGEALIGKSFTKFFSGKPYAGKVVKYLPEHHWYYVEYEDDDNEELVEAELLYLLNKTEKVNAVQRKLKKGKAPGKGDEKAKKRKR